MGTTLLVGPAHAALQALERQLQEAGLGTRRARDLDQARALLQGEPCELLVVDLSSRDAASAERELEPYIRAAAGRAVLALTREPADQLALGVLRAGARDLLEWHQALPALRRCLERIEREALQPRSSAALAGAPAVTWVGRSPALRRTLDQIARVASAPRTTVLLLGESGTGKELAARAIHAASTRAKGPFVAINCAALNEGLLEAELFGYERGAFTGASSEGRQGLLAAAEGGSLLLDEIGELAAPLQAKLLRVLQERSYRRVGGTEDLTFDARVLAATHRDLDELVAAGRFRADLFYRLNVMSVRLPALRERLGDIEALARSQLQRLALEFGRGPFELSEPALRRLQGHAWPGNVRELHNALERAALLAREGHLGPEAFDGILPSDAAPEPEVGGDLSLAAAEQRLLREAMQRARGNRSQAARLLGVHRSTLYEMLRRSDAGSQSLLAPQRPVVTVA